VGAAEKALCDRISSPVRMVRSPCLDDLTARYNIAPSQDVPVIIRNSPNRIVMMRWGLIPHWAKDESMGRTGDTG
jgi:putative SOS response-associated peptidase YedK